MNWPVTPVPIYVASNQDGALRQSEIITNLKQFTYYPHLREAIETLRPYAILLSQDCDLLRDHEARNASSPDLLNGILFFELEPVDVVRPKLAGGDIFKRIKRHSEERYHMLLAVAPELDLLQKGLPELIIDFRRCFTMKSDDVYRQCALDMTDGARRRCRLDMPYREHLQSRAAYYFQRVALPDDGGG